MGIDFKPASTAGKDAVPAGIDFKFVASLSGFVPRDPGLIPFMDPGSCVLPSFHCLGEADQITPPAR